MVLPKSPPNPQLRATPPPFLSTTWIGFDPVYIATGHPQQASHLWKVALASP